MSKPKCNKICLESNIMEPYVVAECMTQTTNGISSLNITAVEENSNKVTKRLDNNTPNPENKTHVAPWFDLEFIEKNSKAYFNSTSELKKILNDPQKKKEMYSNRDAVYNYDSSNDIIVPIQEKSDPIGDALKLPLEDVPEDIRAEMIKRMLGYFD